MEDQYSSIVLFDGVCNFCNASVQAIIKRDPIGKFRFASLQSDFGQKVLEEHGLDQEDFHSMILLQNGKIYLRSTAALRISKGLTGAWSLFYPLILLPVSFRDFFYKLIARNRYYLFGKKESCMLPTPEIKSRFISE